MSSTSWRTFLRALLTPNFCLHCQRYGAPLCADCHHSLTFFWPKLQPPAVQIMAQLAGPLATLLKAYKYQDARNLAPFLAQLLTQHLVRPPGVDCLTFVPLHPRKLRQRGFNQCQDVAVELGRRWQWPVRPLLRRLQHLSPQAQIKDQALRRKRVAGIFAADLTQLSHIAGQRLLLLDDVWTTGATWQAAQAALLAAGAAEVRGLILASKMAA